MQTYTGHSRSGCYDVYELKLKNQYREINWYVNPTYYNTIKKDETIIIE